MSNINFTNTEALPGDTLPVLYAKLLQRLGGQPALGDTQYDSIRKIAELRGASPRPGDTSVRLLSEWLAAESGSGNGAQSAQNAVLAELVRERGGTPAPGDNEWLLVAKLLGSVGGTPVPPVLANGIAYRLVGESTFTIIDNPTGSVDLSATLGIEALYIQNCVNLESFTYNNGTLTTFVISGAPALANLDLVGSPCSEEFTTSGIPGLGNVLLQNTSITPEDLIAFANVLAAGAVDDGSLFITTDPTTATTVQTILNTPPKAWTVTN
jgi:hypothetical protein